jgi:hypothetical protein
VSAVQRVCTKFQLQHEHFPCTRSYILPCFGVSLFWGRENEGRKRSIALPVTKPTARPNSTFHPEPLLWVGAWVRARLHHHDLVQYLSVDKCVWVQFLAQWGRHLWVAYLLVPVWFWVVSVWYHAGMIDEIDREKLTELLV